MPFEFESVHRFLEEPINGMMSITISIPMTLILMKHSFIPVKSFSWATTYMSNIIYGTGMLFASVGLVLSSIIIKRLWCQTSENPSSEGPIIFPGKS